MDTVSPRLVRSLSGAAGIVAVGFLLWHDGSLAALLNGGAAPPPQTAEHACAAAKGIATIHPDGSANGKFTKFLRIDADCDRRTLTFAFAISAESRQVSDANLQTLAASFRQQSCASQKLHQLTAYGWTLGASYSFNDQVTRSTPPTSCS